jgi:TPR repeat protein
MADSSGLTLSLSYEGTQQNLADTCINCGIVAPGNCRASSGPIELPSKSEEAVQMMRIFVIMMCLAIVAPCFGDLISAKRTIAYQGDTEAQYDLGVIYNNGEGIRQDYKKAMEWFRLAADQGYAPAQYNMGVMYAAGQGARQDFREAMKWSRLAADQGDSLAQYNVGAMYAEGIGAAQDYREAMTWFQRAADQGHSIAQYNVGVMYDQGIGTAKNHVLAHMWYSIGATSGHVKAKGSLDQLADNMTLEHISMAQQMASEWLAAHPSI